MDIELSRFSTYGLLEINKTIKVELCSNYYEGGFSLSSAVFLDTNYQVVYKYLVPVVHHYKSL